MDIDRSQSPLPLAGKLALVTGSARGIGAAAAIGLARQGCSVALNDLVIASDTARAAELAAEGVEADTFPADVSDPDAVAGMLDRIEQRFGRRIDILVSNAAYSDRKLFYQADMEGFRKTIDVCMWGPFYLARGVANRLIATGGGGCMVFVSSPHAYKAIPGAMAYNMAKAALDQLARTAACELAEYRIRVNIVHPGWTDTPGERKFFSEQQLAEHGAALPWGRLASIEDIAHGIIFLCQPASDYITGTTLTIDGGSLLPHEQMFRVRGESRPG